MAAASANTLGGGEKRFHHGATEGTEEGKEKRFFLIFLRGLRGSVVKVLVHLE